MTDRSDEVSMDHVEDYVLGMLDAQELAAFEARLASDRTLQEQVRVSRELLATLALSTPVAAPAHLKARVMAEATRVAPTPVTPLARGRRPRMVLALGAALAASLVLLVKSHMDLTEERGARALARAEADRFAGALAQRDSLIDRLTGPGTELVVLAATTDARPAIKAYLDRARRVGVLTISSLDAAPAGQTYQLWFIVDGSPIPSVTFQTDASGRALISQVTLPSGDIVAAAVTREPEGGSKTPTAPILFMGALRAD